MGHSLGADDAEALPMGRHGDDGGAVVKRAERVVRDEAERARDAVAERPVPGDGQLHAVVRGREQVEDPLLGREPSRVEHLGRLRLLADRGRYLDAAADHAHLAGAELARSVGQRGRGAEREGGRTEDPAREPRRPPRDLDVRAPELDDEGPAETHRDPAEREPVRVHEIGIAGGALG